MSRLPEICATLCATIWALTGPAAAEYGLGRPALPEEIAAWDVDVLPDGRGLPDGAGDVATGETLFADHCAACHGDFAEGLGNWPGLAGGRGTLDRADPVKTVGSYWPHLSTLWDYVHRSMPFGAAQTLSEDEVYAITAYILYSNDLVAEGFTLGLENFLEVEMPNAEGFIVDDRPETEYPLWRGTPCMAGCKDSVEITRRASQLDVTPQDDGAARFAALSETVNSGTAEALAAQPSARPEAPDASRVTVGARVFRTCKSCHRLGAAGGNRSGPALTGIVGQPAGAVAGYRYSGALRAAGAAGLVWTEAELKAFLARPRAYMKGTRMAFPGLRDAADRDAVVAYLKSFPAE